MIRMGREKERQRQRERNRERRKRGNRKYGQAKSRHARKGLLSSMIAGIVSIIFISLIVTAFIYKGWAHAIIGGFGWITVIFACIGFVIGIRGFRERDKNYLTCKIGIGVNGFILLFLMAAYIRGIV